MVKSFFAFAMNHPSGYSRDQFHGTGRRAHLAFVNDIREHVARFLLRLGLVDLRQVVGFASLGPGLKPLAPGVELLWRVAGLDLVIALLESRVDEITGDVGDRRIFAM